MATASVKLSLDNAEFMARMAASQRRISEFASSVRGVALAAGAAIGGLVGIYGATQGMGKAIGEAANMEKLEVAFSTLIGNSRLAKETLAELVAFADSTPFELNQLAPAAKQLLAYGFAAKDLVPTLTMLGDVASGLDVPLGELVEVFGKNIAQSRLFTQDLNQFQSRGIPIVEALAKTMGKSETAVRDMTTAGKVGSADLLRAFQSLTGPGGRFGGMMAEQSKTFSGVLSTLKDKIDALFRDFGKPLIAALKPVLDWVQSQMGAWQKRAAEWGEALAKAIRVAFTAVKGGKVGELVGVALQLGFVKAVILLDRLLMSTIAGASAGISALFDNISSASGSLNYLADSDWWAGVGKVAVAALAKVGVFLLDVAASFVSVLAAGLKKAAEEVAEELPGGEPARDFGTIYRETKGAFAPGLDAMREGYRKLELSGAADALAAYDKRGTTPGGAASIAAAIAAARKEFDAASNTGLESTADSLAATLRKLVGELDAAGQRAEGALKPKDKDGAPIAGKDFSAPLEPATASGGAKFSVLADSLAKVGGGGLWASMGPSDPLLAEGKRQSDLLAKIERNTQRSPGDRAGAFTLSRR